jgi:hypothetical protein
MGEKEEKIGKIGYLIEFKKSLEFHSIKNKGVQYSYPSCTTDENFRDIESPRSDLCLISMRYLYWSK